MSDFPKRPTEFYGHYVSQETKDSFIQIFQEQQCPYLRRTCVKQRKSDSRQTIGACSVGYKGTPLIVCPHRFIQRYQIFLDSVRLITPRLQYFIVPEITMPGGNIDYCVVGTRGDEIVDYVGIEIQSLDTTQSGGIWDAREDLLQGTLGSSYNYGINWKMSAKTILMQMHHKAESFNVLGKKLVLVIQREFYNYMSSTFKTGHIRQSDDTDTVQFHIYDTALLGSELQIVLADRKSTTVQGVELMLQLGKQSHDLELEVLERIRAKMPLARRLEVPTPDSPPIYGVAKVDETGEELGTEDTG